MTIHDAFQRVRRGQFLREESRLNAGVNMPIPIGYGQTNSQPSTVKHMLEWLDVREGQKVLDVGSGSGWTTALLATLVGNQGHVYAVEIVPELVRFGRENCRRAGITNATFTRARAVVGLPRYAPYDKILVSASATHLPEGLLKQLRSPGTLVVPVGDSIYEIDKDATGTITTLIHRGFVFVPLIETD